MRNALKVATVLRGGGAGVYTPTLTYGAELLTNGNFSAWTGDNPDGWTVVNESGSDPMVTQVASGGGAGSGAARLYASTAINIAIQQAGIATVGNYYETAINVTAFTGGRLDPVYTATASFLTPTATSVRNVRAVSRAAATGISLQMGGSAPRDLVVDSVSFKALTLSPEKTAPAANMDVTFLYTLPASPLAGDSVWLPARISSFSSGNYWLVFLEYTGSQWNVYLYSVTSHARTQQKTASNVGTTNGLRFYANGTTIRMYTTANGGGSWTQRDTDLTSSTYQSSTGYNVIAGSQFTPGALAATVAA